MLLVIKESGCMIDVPLLAQHNNDVLYKGFRNCSTSLNLALWLQFLLTSISLRLLTLVFARYFLLADDLSYFEV